MTLEAGLFNFYGNHDTYARNAQHGSDGFAGRAFLNEGRQARRSLPHDPGAMFTAAGDWGSERSGPARSHKPETLLPTSTIAMTLVCTPYSVTPAWTRSAQLEKRLMFR